MPPTTRRPFIRHTCFSPLSFSCVSLAAAAPFQKLDLKFNAKFDLQKHGYELQKLYLVTATQAKGSVRDHDYGLPEGPGRRRPRTWPR